MLWRRELLTAAGYGLLMTLLGAALAWPGRLGLPLQVNQKADRTITARLDFTALDQEATEQRRRDARELTPAVYAPNQGHLDQLQQRLLQLIALAEKESIEQVAPEVRQARKLDEQGLAALKQVAQRQAAGGATWQQLVDQFMQNYEGLALLSSEAASRERDRTRAPRIVIEHPTLGRQYRNDDVLIDVRQEQQVLLRNVKPLTLAFPPALRETVAATVLDQPAPNYLIDQAATRVARDAAVQAVHPRQITYKPGDVLVEAGQTITRLDKEVLENERGAYQAHLAQQKLIRVGDQVQLIPLTWLQLVAVVGLIGMISAGLWAYISAYKPRIIENPMRAAALITLMLLGQAVAVIGSLWQPQLVYATAVFATLLVTVVLAIAYDQRFALAVGGVHALLVAVSLQLSTGFVVVVLASVVVAVRQLREVGTRSTIVRVGLWTALATAGAVILVGLLEKPLHLPDQLTRIFLDSLLAAGAVFATGLLVQGLLPAIEKSFHVTTAMTLKELNDASHPLLRRLAQDAPGTYRHSLTMADMSEAAAEAIGANGLMCKVGAMYHDIGKINKPQYFIENQAGRTNRHDKLSPAMSVLIIVGHVKDGIEMAREFRLPSVIRHFIESHHGTTLVEYFYHAAKAKSEQAHVPAPAEFEFRYPGPKPQTREAGIMLICDCVESAARSLPEPTPVRIEQLIHQLTMKRLMDGQFDECHLTLSELHQIEESLTKTLCAVYHGRVAYPGRTAPGGAAPGGEDRREGSGHGQSGHGHSDHGPSGQSQSSDGRPAEQIA